VIAAACLSLILAAPPAVEVPLGAATLDLEVAVELRTGASAEAPALAWRTLADGALEGRGATREEEATVLLAPLPGGARSLEVALRWRAPAALERAAVRLAWRGAPRAVGRDLALTPLGAAQRTGRGTPILIVAGPALLAGGPGLVGARAEPFDAGPAPRSGRPGKADAARGVRVALLLDDADERPFSTYDACLDRLPDDSQGQPIRWAALEVRHRVRGVSRLPGDEDRARATLYPVGAAAPLRPVIVERWPAGTRAAVVLTDHADRTDPDALRAVLWGSSDPRAAGGVGAGLLGRGLKITRTFFVHARSGALDDPEVGRLADDLSACGSEVALHSVTPERDDRAAVLEGLALVAPWRPATWIDHQPYTNCEAISSRGAGDGPYGVKDLLAESGVRWVWAAGDIEGRAGCHVVNQLGGAPDDAHPAIFPLPGDDRLWVFRSSMFHASPGELAAALSDAALAQLEAERGLFVAHTYLGPSSRTTRSADQRARLAVVEGPGALTIHPALDAALARLATRVREGRLASMTWVEAGDRLRALGDVEVTYRPDGAAEIHNRGAAPLDALTVAVPAAGLDLALEGTALLGREDDGGVTRLWFDLGPGERAVLRAWDGLDEVPLLPR
jgi:hypothetical protein